MAQRSPFYVVQFLESPFIDIDDYVCVPNTWVILRRSTHQRIVVAYPNNEHPTVIRNRVKLMERYADEWRFYSAEVQYETNTFEDAEYWIALRKNLEPSVSENSNINGAQPQPTSDKQLCNGNRKHSSKSKNAKLELTVKSSEIPRMPLPVAVNKRPASEEPKQPIATKQRKLMKTNATAKCGLIPNPNAKPGCSNKTIAATQGETSTEQSTYVIEQNNNNHDDELSNALVINEYGPGASETNGNGQSSLTSNMTAASMTAPKPSTTVEQAPQPNQLNNQQYSQDSGSSSLNFQLRITDVQSIATTSNNQVLRADDVSNNGPTTFQHIPESLSVSARLYNTMKEKPSLVASQPPIERKMRQCDIRRNMANALQNRSNLMNETESLSRPPAREPPVVTIRNQPLRDMLVESHEPHNVVAVDPNVVFLSINHVASGSQNHSGIPQQRPSFSRPLTEQQNLPVPQQPYNRYPGGRRNRFIGGIELPYKTQLILNEQESRFPPRDPRRPNATFPTPRVERPCPYRRGTSPILSEVPRAINEALCTSQNNYLSNEQRLQVLMNESFAISGNYPDDMGYVSQGDQSTECEARSPFYGTALDTEIDTDHDDEMPTDEEPVETMRFINRIEHNSAGRPSTAQNSSSAGVLEQQILDQYETVVNRMGSNLNYITNMFNQLRESIFETANTCQMLLGDIKELKAMNSPASHASSSSVRREVPLVVEERPAAAVERQNRGINAANQVPETNYNDRWRFVLPPEYDPNDTKWTLKYRYRLEGIVELLPRSGIYVSHGSLRQIKNNSKDCKSLAQELLMEVFSTRALSVCASVSEHSQVDYKTRPNARPALDDHGCLVLLNFVLENGLKRGWNTDILSILHSLHKKVEEMRHKYGVRAKC